MFFRVVYRPASHVNLSTQYEFTAFATLYLHFGLLNFDSNRENGESRSYLIRSSLTIMNQL